MKKFLKLLALSVILSAGIISSDAQELVLQTNPVPFQPPIVAQVNPLLTASQMDGIISLLENNGVAAQLAISSTNLSSVHAQLIGTNYVCVVKTIPVQNGSFSVSEQSMTIPQASMDGLIAAIQSAGITTPIAINSTNLLSVDCARLGFVNPKFSAIFRVKR